uniref:Uncharacterized protein n=1 Tax=Parascaris equorum TaxID=6256 RepID=A0A914S3N9_PAREQ
MESGFQHDFPRWESLVGHTEWSRFGFSLAAAGDLNQDGFNDFIVGAPYDGEDGRGAVYVYHGAKDGLRKEPTQKIEARKVHSDLRAFGYSIAGGKDIDRNQYPGLLAEFMSQELRYRMLSHWKGSIALAVWLLESTSLWNCALRASSKLLEKRLMCKEEENIGKHALAQFYSMPRQQDIKLKLTLNHMGLVNHDELIG